LLLPLSGQAGTTAAVSGRPGRLRLFCPELPPPPRRDSEPSPRPTMPSCRVTQRVTTSRSAAAPTARRLVRGPVRETRTQCLRSPCSSAPPGSTPRSNSAVREDRAGWACPGRAVRTGGWVGAQGLWCAGSRAPPGHSQLRVPGRDGRSGHQAIAELLHTAGITFAVLVPRRDVYRWASLAHPQRVIFTMLAP